jgi:hypothetical protein
MIAWSADCNEIADDNLSCQFPQNPSPLFNDSVDRVFGSQIRLARTDVAPLAGGIVHIVR